LNGQIPEKSVASLRKPNGGIAVTVTRATAILPECSPPLPEHAPGPQFTYSCSTAATLGMMVADPLDLERGRVLGPADGDTLSQSIQRYRAGKVYKPKEESTK
jgi:pilus assembly protein CpaD